MRSALTLPSLASPRRSDAMAVEELLLVIADPSDKRVPDVARACLAALGSQLLSLKKQILDFDRKIIARHRSNHDLT